MKEACEDNKKSGDSHVCLHHRCHEDLMEYWNKLRGNRQFPAENEIEPSDIADIWDYCFLISLDDVVKRIGYRYSYMGKELVDAFGDDPNNPDMALRLLSTTKVPSLKKIEEVLDKKQPVIDEGEFVNAHKMEVRYRTCIVPLGYEDGQVAHLFGVMRWKAY
ncbi:MAG: PAS domain-containing protein [Rickettsiales bacterium]